MEHRLQPDISDTPYPGASRRSLIRTTGWAIVAGLATMTLVACGGEGEDDEGEEGDDD